MTDAIKNSIYNFSGKREPPAVVTEIGELTIKEQFIGGTKWFGLRARGTEWSWITPAEAEKVAKHLTAHRPQHPGPYRGSSSKPNKYGFY